MVCEYLPHVSGKITKICIKTVYVKITMALRGSDFLFFLNKLMTAARKSCTNKNFTTAFSNPPHQYE